MTAQIEWLGEVEGLGRIGRLALPLDEQIEVFQDAGMQEPYLLTTDEAVDVRLAGVSDSGTRTSVVPVALEGERTVLYKPSKRLPSIFMSPAMARVAMAFHGRGEYPKMPKEFYGVAKDIAKSQEGLEPEDRTAIFVPQQGDFSLTPEMPLTKFALGRRTERYFAERVSPSGRKDIPFFGLEGESKGFTTVNYVWFDISRGDSGLDCRNRSLSDHYGALGVLRKTAEGGSREVSGYNLTEIRNANSEVVAEYLQQREMSGLADKFDGLNDALLERLRTQAK